MLSSFTKVKKKTITKAVKRLKSSISKLRIVSFNDVYNLHNLPKLQSFLCTLDPVPDAVILAGDFLSPSPLSSLDGGKGMVQTLRAVGVTHASLGNHEADLKLPKLQKRLKEFTEQRISTRTGRTVNTKILNSNIFGAKKGEEWLMNAPFMCPFAQLRPRDLVFNEQLQQQKEAVNVGLLGLISDEKGVFRDGTFKGAQIKDCLETFTEFSDRIHQHTDVIIPITHQSMKRDKELALHMLQTTNKSSLILGGHEHEPLDETVRYGENSVRILKSGHEAEYAHLIDLSFEKKEHYELQHLDVTLVNITDYNESSVVKFVADTHTSLLTSLQEEEILHAQPFLSSNQMLSSKGTRYQQTTAGALFCMAIKEEMEADVAIINGASIKGNVNYPNGSMSYAQLKQELPFPTKMICVTMTLRELQNAIFYSRTFPINHDNCDKFERRGYLQVDLDFHEKDMYNTGNPDDEIIVALPRNLLKGFCEIKPLVEFGKRLESQENDSKNNDSFIPAFDVVVRHFSKEKWYDIAHRKLTFQDLDRENKGFLSRKDVEQMLHQTIGHSPPEFLIKDMMEAVDTDKNGIIDRGEFSHLLAIIERERGDAYFRNF